MRSHLAILAGAALVLPLAACGTQNTAPSDFDPQVQQILNEYSSPNIDITLAINSVAGQCMRDAGFREDVVSLQPHGYSISGLVGVITNEEEARAGYQSTIAYEVERPLTEAEQEAYYGSDTSETVSVELSTGAVVSRPLEGCAAQAYAEVYGSVENSLFYETFINELLGAGGPGEIKQAINSADHLLAEYTKCIQESSGLNTHSLEETSELVAQKLGAYRQPAESPSAEEVDYALADYRCQQESGYVKAINDAYIEKISDWLTGHEDLILKIRDIEQAAQESSRQILNS